MALRQTVFDPVYMPGRSRESVSENRWYRGESVSLLNEFQGRRQGKRAFLSILLGFSIGLNLQFSILKISPDQAGRKWQVASAYENGSGNTSLLIILQWKGTFRKETAKIYSQPSGEIETPKQQLTGSAWAMLLQDWVRSWAYVNAYSQTWHDMPGTIFSIIPGESYLSIWDSSPLSYG